MSFLVTAAAYVQVVRIYNSNLLSHLETPHSRHRGEGVLCPRLNGNSLRAGPGLLTHCYTPGPEQNLTQRASAEGLPARGLGSAH